KYISKLRSCYFTECRISFCSRMQAGKLTRNNIEQERNCRSSKYIKYSRYLRLLFRIVKGRPQNKISHINQHAKSRQIHSRLSKSPPSSPGKASPQGAGKETTKTRYYASLCSRFSHAITLKITTIKKFDTRHKSGNKT